MELYVIYGTIQLYFLSPELARHTGKTVADE